MVSYSMVMALPLIPTSITTSAHQSAIDAIVEANFGCKRGTVGNDLFLGDPFGVVELNNAADGGVAQGCHQGDDDKEGGGFEQAGVRGEAD